MWVMSNSTNDINEEYNTSILIKVTLSYKSLGYCPTVRSIPILGMLGVTPTGKVSVIKSIRNVTSVSKTCFRQFQIDYELVQSATQISYNPSRNSLWTAMRTVDGIVL